MSDYTDIEQQAEDRARKTQREERRREREAQDFLDVMATKAGRRLIWDLMAKCGIFHAAHIGNAEIYFKQGQRSIGTHYWGLIQLHCPELYPLMVKEANEE